MAWYTYTTNTFKPFYFVEIRLTTTPIGTYELDTRLSLHSLYFVSNHGPIMKYIFNVFRTVLITVMKGVYSACLKTGRGFVPLWKGVSSAYAKCERGFLPLCRF